MNLRPISMKWYKCTEPCGNWSYVQNSPCFSVPVGFWELQDLFEHQATLTKASVDFADALTAWAMKHYFGYASQVYKGKLLRVLINHFGFVKVVYGDDTLFSWANLSKAEEVWKSVK